MRIKEELPFIGIWRVEVQETRIAGEWVREYEFAPGEWLLAFTTQGNYLETFRPENEKTLRQWTFDEPSGTISIFSDPSGFPSVKCVFGPDGRLYYYDDLPYIPRDAAAIVGHHAHTRLKLVKIDE